MIHQDNISDDSRDVRMKYLKAAARGSKTKTDVTPPRLHHADRAFMQFRRSNVVLLSR